MRMPRPRSTSLVVLAIVTLAACGHARDTAGDSTAADSTTADSTPPATAPSSSAAVTPAWSSASDAAAPITVADIDAWQKGMDAELKAVQDAGTRMKSAKTPNDTLDAMTAGNEMSTRAAGAKAAGVSEARYQYLASTLGPIVGNLSPVLGNATIKDLPPSVAAQMHASEEQSAAKEMSGMSPDVVSALRTRAPALSKENFELAAARLKAAGAIH